MERHSGEGLSPTRRTGSSLRRGWTTGACATAAVKAAATALVSGDFPDPVTIRLPGGQEPAFALCRADAGSDWARASVIKDAGDDPDVTHHAEIIAEVRLPVQKRGGCEAVGVHAGLEGGLIRLFAGSGIGQVTLPGLPIAPGEPAINPVPRRMIRDVLVEVADGHGLVPQFDVELSIPGGQELAEQTWNPRLGIVGGLSILGTTGIVVPYSCAAWIDAIHRGVDVARAAGLDHLVGATGRGSEQAARCHYRLSPLALIDMGDFAGGFLKYARSHPVSRLSIAGGFAKIAKLAQGALDLHSARSQVDLIALADIARSQGARNDTIEAIAGAATATGARIIADDDQIDLAGPIAHQAAERARSVVEGSGIAVNALVVGRDGAILAESEFA